VVTAVVTIQVHHDGCSHEALVEEADGEHFMSCGEGHCQRCAEVRKQILDACPNKVVWWKQLLIRLFFRIGDWLTLRYGPNRLAWWFLNRASRLRRRETPC
jgi:hypothetical protein